jgi:hypothetical protein
MIFILMIELTGCYSTRIVASSDIKPSEICFIHGQRADYHISDVVISDGILSGKTGSVKKDKGNKNINHIYISSDSVVKIENNILNVPVWSITKIEQRVPDPEKTKELKTALIVGCSALTVLGIISTIMMIHAANDAANACGTTYSNLNNISCSP